MMKKLVLASFLVAVLVLSLTATAFAYTPVEGCTFDGYGNPWTHGGSVMCYREVAGLQILVGSGTLDANGCFSVPIGNGPQVNCYIDFTPGPEGDPADGLCTVPTDPNYTPAPYTCAPISTGTGPNAVVLSGLGAAAGMPAGTLVLALGAVLGGAAVWLRRR